MNMKYNKLQLASDLVMVKMFTASYKVPELNKFVKEHNPNEHSTDMPVDLSATELTAGSTEYIEWVKKQVKEGKQVEDTNLMLDSEINLVSHHHHKKVSKKTKKVSHKNHH